MAGSGLAAQRVEIQLPPLFEWQEEVMADPARYRVILCARQIGKTVLSVWEGINTALRGGDVWWIAPDFSLTEPGYDLMMELLEQPPFLADRPGGLVRHEKKRQTFRFQNGARRGSIQIKSADNPRKVKGKALDLVILDEFAEMAEPAWTEGAINTITVRRGRALLIGNPPPVKNWAWDLHYLGDPGNPARDPQYRSFTYSQHANPLILLEDIEAKRKTMPYIQFLREVMGQLVDDGGVVFRGVRQAAMIEPGVDVLCEPLDGHEYVIGMDVAAGGSDFTVLIVFDVTAMAQVEMVRFTEPDIDALCERMRLVQEKWKPRFWEIEDNAAGLFLPEFLRKRGFLIRAFNTNWKTKRGLIDEYRAAVELGQVRLLRDAELIREHEGIQMSVTASGQVQYAAPGRQHDDIVISSALAYRAATVRDAASQPGMRRLPFAGLYDRTYSRSYPSWRPAANLQKSERAKGLRR